MTNEDQGDLLYQIRESLERAYAEESPEKKRIRQAGTSKEVVNKGQPVVVRGGHFG